MEQYKVVYSERGFLRDAVQDLEEEVNKHIREGWELQGGVSVAKATYGSYSACQAMVKKEKQK